MSGVSPNDSTCSTYLYLYPDELFATWAALEAAMKDDLVYEVENLLTLQSKSLIASFDGHFLSYLSILGIVEIIDPMATDK